MKKALLTLLPLLLLASCGGVGTSSNPASEVSDASAEPATSATSEKGVESESKQESKEESKEQPTSSQERESTPSSNPGSSTPTTPTSEEGSIDVSGIVEEAYAGDGVVLNDWTDEMKAILRKYLNGNVPPFYKMPSIRVTYDELGYLSVTGDATKSTEEDELNDFAEVLIAGGWDTLASRDYSNRPHMYGRYFASDCLVESDTLVSNGIVSTNYSFSTFKTEWPTNDLSAVMMEYGSEAILPEVEADQYIVQISSFYDMQIYCMGTNINANSAKAYAALLQEYRWTVTEEEGYYTADSLDRFAHLEFFFDGTGLMLVLSHGDGEFFTSWDQCVPAIEDFVKNDLGLSGLSLDVPAFEGGAQYEIGRVANGWLNIYVHKDGSYKEYETQEVYRSALTEAGYTIDATRVNRDGGVGYFAIPPQKDFAIMFLLHDAVNDIGDPANYFEISICSYRGYEGYYVNNEWPGSYINSVLSHIGARDVVIPGYEDASTYYWKRNEAMTKMFIEIADPAEGALESYKNTLTRYDFSVTDGENSFVAIDSSQKVSLTAKKVGKELHIVVEGYVPAITNGTIDFKDISMIADKDVGYTYCVWGGSPFSFRLDKASSSVAIGNMGDYIYNPLRVYKDQKVTIAPEEGKQLKTVTFYITDAKAGNGSIAKGFDKSYFTGLSIAGATLTDSVPSLDKYVYTVDSNHATTGLQFTASLGGFALSKIVVDVQ